MPIRELHKSGSWPLSANRSYTASITFIGVHSVRKEQYIVSNRDL